MGTPPGSTDADRARSWLMQQRLPHHDEAAVALVAARLAARRRGRWVDGLLFLGFGLAYLTWLVARDGGDSGFPAFLTTVVPMAVAMSIVLLRRSVLWWRRERDAAAQLRGRVAALDRPTWGELLGRPTVALLAGLTVAALVTAVTATPAPHEPGRAARVVLVVLGVGFCAALLELARRRSVLARDVVTLAADRRLRVEEAVDAVGWGALCIALVPAPAGGNGTATVLFLGGYGLVLAAGWWHARQARTSVLVATPQGAR